MKEDDKRQLLTAVGMVGNVGLGMVAAVIVGFIGGRFIDDWLDIGPWAKVAGIVLGMLAGLWSAYKQVTGNK